MSLREELLNSGLFKLKNNVLLQHKLEGFSEFEKTYLDIREKENRLLNDATVRILPDIPVNHPLGGEWRIRKSSSEKLILYLEKKQPGRILEIGCGNGWLSNKLSNIPGTEVVALDVNQYELEQGARVFEQNPKLTFLYGDIFTLELPVQFDCIILASSIQYFVDIRKLITRLSEYIQPSGEIHIVDSPFYSENEIAHAAERTKQYLSKLGHESNSISYYHHHSLKSLSAFNVTMQYNPRGTITRLRNFFVKDSSPFPWLIIKK